VPLCKDFPVTFSQHRPRCVLTTSVPFHSLGAGTDETREIRQLTYGVLWPEKMLFAIPQHRKPHLLRGSELSALVHTLFRDWIYVRISDVTKVVPCLLWYTVLRTCFDGAFMRFLRQLHRPGF